jgi:hypothetical protein
MKCPKCKRFMKLAQGYGGKYYYCSTCKQSLSQLKRRA